MRCCFWLARKLCPHFYGGEKVPVCGVCLDWADSPSPVPFRMLAFHKERVTERGKSDKPKVHSVLRLLSNRTDHRVRAMYDDSVRTIRQYLVRQGDEGVCDNCTYVGMWNYKTNTFQPQVGRPDIRMGTPVVTF